MAIYVDSGWQVCGDCLHTAANGAPNWDGYADTGHAARYAAAVNLNGGELVPDIDPDTGEIDCGFSRSACDWCGDTFGGDRYAAAVHVTVSGSLNLNGGR